MKIWKQFLICAAIFTLVAAAGAQDRPRREGDGDRPRREGAQGRQRQGGDREGAGRMTPEERAKLAKEAAPLTALAIAQYLKLSSEAAKKFSGAYVIEAAAAQKRFSDAFESQDRSKMGEVFRQNDEKMQEVLKSNLTEEQAKKAGAVLGRFSSLDRSIQSLLRAKVEKEKINKALPVLVKSAAAQGELFAKMRDGGSGSREELMPKFRELREQMLKELTPIVGEEAAAATQRFGGRGGFRPGGGQGGADRPRGGNRPGGAEGGAGRQRGGNR